jgi:serine/threonine protein kinase
MKQILLGMQYLHQNKVFHRDLKPHNILISHAGTVKIADFGLSRVVGMYLETMSKEIETLWYRAPELLLGTTKYNLAVDVWSLGCIFYEITEFKVLFQTES